MVNINKHMKTLLHPADGHPGSHKAHQAGNMETTVWLMKYAQDLSVVCFGWVISMV